LKTSESIVRSGWAEKADAGVGDELQRAAKESVSQNKLAMETAI